MASPTPHRSSGDLGSRHWAPGSQVAVRNRFTGGWAEGFLIEDRCDPSTQRYRLRRVSDDVVLPATFPATDLRPA
jgi:hypothetical protein